MITLVSKVIAEAKLSNGVIHGVSHWRRVERNGVYLCQFNTADEEVVRLFALFHDCKRRNDGYDREHGPRAAEYIQRIETLIPLNQKQLDDLCLACRTHTIGTEAANETVATCWDADRLDIGRVGRRPHERYMSTDEARRIARQKDYTVLRHFNYSSIFSDVSA